MFISIVTVTFNVDQSLHKLLASTKAVLEKYDDVEHIIIDGVSTDATVAMATQYANSNPNVYFLSEPDGGIYNAMNKGISLSSGEYIHHLNGDDWIDDLDGFDTMYNILKNKLPFVLSSPVAIYAGQHVYRVLPSQPINEFHRKFGFHFPHQGTFFARQVFDLAKGYNERVGYVADKIFCFQLLDTLSLASVLSYDKVTFAQAAGGVSSRSILTPIQTFILTIQASKQVPFKHPIARAFFNLVFKLWLFLKIY